MFVLDTKALKIYICMELEVAEKSVSINQFAFQIGEISKSNVTGSQ